MRSRAQEIRKLPFPCRPLSDFFIPPAPHWVSGKPWILLSSQNLRDRWAHLQREPNTRESVRRLTLRVQNRSGGNGGDLGMLT